jgi:hypothetical protein
VAVEVDRRQWLDLAHDLDPALLARRRAELERVVEQLLDLEGLEPDARLDVRLLRPDDDLDVIEVPDQ